MSALSDALRDDYDREWRCVVGELEAAAGAGQLDGAAGAELQRAAARFVAFEGGWRDLGVAQPPTPPALAALLEAARGGSMADLLYAALGYRLAAIVSEW